MRALLVVFAVSACKFDPPAGGPPSDAAADAPIASEVRFVSVSVDPSAPPLRPGRYGVEITAVLHNGLAEAITNVRPTLMFRQGAMNHDALFRWRDTDARDGATALNPATVEPGTDATFRFRVDALANAVLAGSVQIDGVAEFDTTAGLRAAALLETPLAVPFDTLPAPIVVTTDGDEDDGNNRMSFREAVKTAAMRPGFDRITFDPVAFPASHPAVILFQTNRGDVPTIAEDLVVDGTNTGVVFALDTSWNGRQSYTLRVTGGTVLIHGIEFRDMGFQYPALNPNPGVDNCDGDQQQGGAIAVDGGTLILDGNRFFDSNVAERNCFAASVRLRGGSAHRILNNHWEDQSMDAVAIFAPTIEVSDNVMIAGSALDPGKTDDSIDIERLDNSDLWVTGNLFVDHESSAVFTRGPETDTGVVHVVNNTFVRTRDHAVRRLGAFRRVELHNNAYHGNAPQTILGNFNATGLTLSHESVTTNDAFCNMCSAATNLDGSPQVGDLRLTNPAGVTIDHFTPASGSPLIDSGADLLDRNGRAPRRFHGSGPDRGAVERQE